MKRRSKWAKQQLKRLLELEGDALDLIAIHDAATELFLSSPLTAIQENRSKVIERKLTENARLPKVEKNSDSTKGFIYVVKSSDGKHKIGRARDVRHRLGTLQTGSHKKLNLILKVKTSNCSALENICHRKFENKKVRGEWFDLADEDLNWIKNLPKM